MAHVDENGFLTGEPLLVKAPHHVEVPKFFGDVYSRDEAIQKMIAELAKPASVQLDGYDEMYRRLANALILVLSMQGDLSP